MTSDESSGGRHSSFLIPHAALPSEPALIGVSGGRDSVALLHALVARGFRQLFVCHFDHALRPESAEDAGFVRRLARRWKLPVVIEREDVARRAKRRKQSLETAAREARYAFFARVAAARDCPRLLLAHHADDQVETFLFNLFRGAGAAGLAGMAIVSRRTIDGVELAIHRPLLGTWRAEIDAYLAAHALDFREDPSNADPRHTRNRLRHEVLPAIERAFGREVRQALWRASQVLRAESALLEGLLPREPLPAALEVRGLRALPEALQRRQIHAWLRARGVPDVGFGEVEAVRSLLLHEQPAKVNLPGRAHARRRAGQLFLERARE
jgi:tRNA(Ile)-lysidine synthase